MESYQTPSASALQVFKDICDYVVDATFLQAQHEFLMKNVNVFEDTDENKLEYTEIHGQYVYIMEELIEAKLREKYSEPEIEAFYLAFKENLPAFEAEDSNAFDIMNSMIDFVKFKDQMLKFKQTVQNDTNLFSQESATNQSGMKVGENDLAKFKELIAEDMNDTKVLKWKKSVDAKKTKDYQFTMWQRPTGEGHLNLMRIDSHYKNINITRFMEIIMDFNLFKTPQHKEITEVEKIDGNSAVWYMRTKMPLMTDRDMLILVKSTPQEDNTFLVSIKSIERDDVPVKPGCIRMDFNKISLVKQVGPDLDIIEFSSMNMKGSFPVRLLNMTMGSMATQQLKTLYPKLKELGC